jgi:hypothetical protein
MFNLSVSASKPEASGPLTTRPNHTIPSLMSEHSPYGREDSLYAVRTSRSRRLSVRQEA